MCEVSLHAPRAARLLTHTRPASTEDEVQASYDFLADTLWLLQQLHRWQLFTPRSAGDVARLVAIARTQCLSEDATRLLKKVRTHMAAPQ